MTSRMKEDEKNEKIIRGLLKLPENRRCINCNSLGPQYVCTTFWIFICTTCSGIHREFTHRVKSISIAKFTSQEVIALQEGGNQRARGIYFKEWDMQRNSLPNSSNPNQLRDFIKHVYVERRYTGERSYDKPPRANMEEDSYHGSSRSKPHEDAYDHQYNERSSPSVRGPGYEQDKHQYDYHRSPTNNWQRDDKFGNERNQDNSMSGGKSNLEAQSSERPVEVSGPPGLRPVKDILSEKALLPRKIDPPKTDVGRTAHSAVFAQRSASSNSFASTSGSSQEVKLEKSISLIDFDADPKPPVSASSQAPQPPVNQTINQATIATGEENWASFDSIPDVKAPAPKSANMLDSILSQLSVPASAPGHVSGAPAGNVMNNPANNPAGPPFTPVGSAHLFQANAGGATAVPLIRVSMFPEGSVSVSTLGSQPMMPATSGDSVIMQYQQQSMFPPSNMQSIQRPTQPVGISSNQRWNTQLAPNLQQSTSASTVQASQSVAEPLRTTSSVIQPPVGVKEGARKELPVDLFTAAYHPSIAGPVPRWQTIQPYGMGFPMQYNSAMTMPGIPQPSKSVNPFNPSERSPAQPLVFPSMASLHGALPNVPPSSNLLRSASHGSPLPAWMTPQSPYHMPAMPPQANSFAPAAPPNVYMVQEAPGQGHIPIFRRQGVGAFGVLGSSVSVSSNQPVSRSFSAPSTPNPYPPASRNPFD